MKDSFVIRPAEPQDREVLGELAAQLVRFHHAIDSHRFMLPDRVEAGYGRWLVQQAKDADCVVLVAEVGGAVVGYTYACKEPRNWNDLIDEHGKLHDIFVHPDARRHGVARALLDATLRRLEGLGCERIVLATAIGNDAAQRLFASFGFEPTMVEMTRRSG
ncbi:MAG: GNAT family N-acetyltransferase [Polyangiaceae bacterium]|nr:GNAT family N-acetyltransferase [Polyangiaceae bacterium]